MTFYKSKLFQWIVVVLIIVLIALGTYVGCNSFFEKARDIEQAKIVALDKANLELGEGCEIVCTKFDQTSKAYFVGCVSRDNSYAILYIVKHSKDKKEWLAQQMISRKGGNARELFNNNFTYIE